MPGRVQGPQTLYEKILNSHIVDEKDGEILIYIDRHLVHEVTSPQSFDGLRKAGRPVRRPDCTLATMDHNVPTTSRSGFTGDIAKFIEEEASREQCLALERNVKQFGVKYFSIASKNQGIVHVIGPEQGFTLPGTTIVCGDSHTATHGAFGALAFGIGTSEVEHVLATQCLTVRRSKNMKITVDGPLGPGISSKDIILKIIATIGVSGGNGHVIEYCGSAIESLSMEARMTIANMSIEAGARSGLMAPDEKTFAYIKGRPLAPKDGEEFEKACSYWKSLQSDPGAKYDKEIVISTKDLEPYVTWGTTPGDAVPISGNIPHPEDFEDEGKRESCRKSLEYMDLKPGIPVLGIELDKVFIGSCTNSRIEDLRIVASILDGRKISPNLKELLIVPGSGKVKKQAEDEGLDQIFIAAGASWREAGCSACLGMNPDILQPGERCASTSNRNFRGRQGFGGRTILVSPATAAASALAGKLADVRQLTPDTATATKSKRRIDVSSEAPEVDSDASAEETMDLPEDGSQSNSKQAAGGSGGMQKFTILKGVAAPINVSNIDTDMIIPAKFLKTVSRDVGDGLFYNWAHNSDGSPNKDWLLNKPEYKDTQVLVVSGSNFGCGSSREHAPWALLSRGIRCVIAESFADIYATNCTKNGILNIILSGEPLKKVAAEAEQAREVEVDLPNQVIKSSDGKELAKFEVDAWVKHLLVEGLDAISITLKEEEKIRAYEQQMKVRTPWIGDAGYLKRQGSQKVEAVKLPTTNRGEELEVTEW